LSCCGPICNNPASWSVSQSVSFTTKVTMASSSSSSVTAASVKTLSSSSSSSYDDMIEKDLELLYAVQDYITNTPWLHEFFMRIISKYPWKDVVIVVWFFFIIGVIEVGRNHFWIVAMNLMFAMGMSP
jgi:hypothetical protein